MLSEVNKIGEQLMNMKNIYTVVYNKPSNPNYSRPQNAARNVTSRILVGAEEAREFACEVVRRGYSVIHVFNGIGQKVTL